MEQNLIPTQTIPLAVQMYTLRNVSLELDELFARVAEMGYSGVETFMFGPPGIAAKTFRASVEKHGLRVVSACVALELLESDFDQVVAYHQTLGTDTLTIPWIPDERQVVDEVGCIALGQMLDESGLCSIAVCDKGGQGGMACGGKRYNARTSGKYSAEL